MPDADGMILAKEEENDAEVRREDQDQINEFGRLNARLYEVKSEVDRLKVSDNVFCKYPLILSDNKLSSSSCSQLTVCLKMPYSIPIQKLLEKIDDASTELMMGNGERVMLRLGEAMFDLFHTVTQASDRFFGHRGGNFVFRCHRNLLDW